MASACFHCGDPLPQGKAILASLGDGQHEVCCNGCKAVAEFISAGGMQAFYRHRTALPDRAEPRAPASDFHRYDMPAVRARYVVDDGGCSVASVDIGGMYCGACSWLLNRALHRHPGVQSVDISPLTKRAVVQWHSDALAFGELLGSIAAVGFQPRPVGAGASDGGRNEEYRSALKRLIVAAAAGMQVMMFALALYAGERFGIAAGIESFLRAISMLVCLPIVVYSARPFFAGAWRGLRSRSPGMDLPVAIAISIAFVASVAAVWTGRGAVYFDSVAMFVLFLSAARFLEMRARHNGGDLAQALAQLLPATAHRIGESGENETIAVDDLAEGDRVRILPGGIIPADACIESGELSLDESILSGESVPVLRAAGAGIFAGATVRAGSAIVCVTRTGAASSVAEIARLLDRAAAARPRIVQLADRIASFFVIAVLLLAAATGLIWLTIDAPRAFEVMLATLVVTCPCALALATPAALAAATASLAREGCFLVTSRLLDVLRPGATVVFDKTGTLTHGKPEVSRIRLCAAAGELNEEDCFALASAMEGASEHVLARAFNGAKERQFALSEVTPKIGLGVDALFEGKRFRLGSAAFVSDLLTEPMQADAVDEGICGTQVYLASEQGLLAAFTVTDELRSDARSTIAALRAAGYRVVLASGDRPAVVAAVADRLVVDEWQAGLSPKDKLDFVRDRQASGDKVIMVGDGINDAPVLAAADASIAIDAGTALARASADAVVVSHRLTSIVAAAGIAELTRRTIRQNLVWAAVYNIAAVPLAATGMLAPWMAALGMSFSSLLVVANALRVKRYRLQHAGAEPADARSAAVRLTV